MIELDNKRDGQVEDTRLDPVLVARLID